MKRINLKGAWQAECLSLSGHKEFDFTGNVPGCVHTDLQGIKLPEDIFYRDNYVECAWIENRDYKYSKTFVAKDIVSPAKLVFEGLDTYCDVYLNKALLGKADNMFISHTFDVSDCLLEGENLLEVYFHSPIEAVKDKPELVGSFTTERLHSRRMQCTYGWDWVARFVTCGIFRDVYIEFGDELTLNNTYIRTEFIEADSAQISVELNFDNWGKGKLIDLEIISPENEKIYSHTYFVNYESLKEYIDIPSAKLWYPVGYGEQPLYTLKVCGKEEKFGIRTVRIVELPDAPDSEYIDICNKIKGTKSAQRFDRNEEFSGFELRVNNIPIMCKGANWVPCEPFPSAESDEKITDILSLSVEMGVNMVRVWGGGIFEKPHFYNECDRLGILVTQDFLMACGNYPEKDEEFLAQLQKEAEYAAITLRNHPCLMWWSGDNENAVNGADDMENYQGKTAIYRGIAPVLYRLDPARRLLASSPYGGRLYSSKTVGTTHNTHYLGEMFNYIENTDMSDYKDFLSLYTARFIAEEPSMGACSKPTLNKIMTEDEILSDSEMWLHHTKGNPGMARELFDYIVFFAEKVLGRFKDGTDRFFKLKYVQYEWARVSLELARRNKGFCNGIIYWMLNDCWPAAAGWAFIDYYGLPKASYYSFKRCAEKVVASIDKTDVYVCNDSLSEHTAELTIQVIRNGESRKVYSGEVKIAPATSAIVYKIPDETVLDTDLVVCDIRGDFGANRAFYKKGVLPLKKYDGLTIVKQTENSVTVTADSYVHAVELEGEYIFDDNYFSLLPSEEKTVFIRPVKNQSTDGITLTAYTVEQ